MMEQGFLDEVKGLLEQPNMREARPMESLGYSHLRRHLDGEIDLVEALRLAKRDTRHYARRQLNWFRGQFAQTEWIPPGPPGDPLLEFLKGWRSGQDGSSAR
jgi:tRNA dimethylallyltransferase